MIGYFSTGKCFPTALEAFADWQGRFPAFGFDTTKNQIWTNSLDTYTVNADGSFIANVIYNDGVLAPVNIPMAGRLETCTLPDDFLSMPSDSHAQAYLLFAVLFIVAFMGFRAGFKP